ncbi:uncharacterized protein LJ206_007507 isoform 2-T4 [Theristicus caerulescens]
MLQDRPLCEGNNTGGRKKESLKIGPRCKQKLKDTVRAKEMCYIFNTSRNIRHWDVKEMTNLRVSEHLDSVFIHYDTQPHRVYSTDFLKQKRSPARL